MYCIERGSLICLRELCQRGVNMYSIRNEIQKFINPDHLCSVSCVKFVLENMYKIEMLAEPVLKYFLIGLIRFKFPFDVPKEIFVYILQLYMKLDYEYTDSLKKLLSEIEID